MEMLEKIRSGRLRLGESEEVFGRRFGVTRATVQQWEKPGGTAPKLERITEVADALGLTLDELTTPRRKRRGFPFHRIQPMPQRDTGLKASPRADTANPAAKTLRAAGHRRLAAGIPVL